MSWWPLILVYTACLFLATLLQQREISSQSGALLRTLAAGTLILMLGELIAEERGFWFITHHSGLLFLSAPIEGALLVIATLLNSLLPYLWLKRRMRPRRAGLEQQQRVPREPSRK